MALAEAMEEGWGEEGGGAGSAGRGGGRLGRSGGGEEVRRPRPAREEREERRPLRLDWLPDGF